MSIKGWPSQKKDDRLNNEFTTISKTGENKIALDVRDIGTVTSVGTDAVEAGTTAEQIVATTHGLRIGDRLRITSGNLAGVEVNVFEVTDADIVQLEETLSEAPAIADTFEVLRPVSMTLSSTGGTSSINTFVRNGVNQEVTQDTVTPANNRPLPVQIYGVDPISITADQLNINLDSTEDSVEALQATHDNLNLNANIQVGDSDVANGNPVPVSDAGGSLTIDNTNIDAALSTLATQATLNTLNGKFVSGTDIGDVTINNAAGASAVNIQDGGNSITVDGLVTIQDGGGSITIDNANLDAALSTLATQATAAIIAGDTTSLDAKQPALGSGLIAASMPVNIASDQTVPVSVASLPLPAGAATEATLATIDADTSILAGAVSGSEMQVDIVSSALPTGAATSALQTTGNTSLNTIASWDTNTGAPSSNTLRVAPALNSKIGLKLETHESTYTDVSVSNIPGSASLPLQLVASLGQATTALQVFDTSGAFLEIMVGAAAAETRICVVGPGNDQIIYVEETAAAASSRISVRRIDSTSALTAGGLAINYMF